MYVNSRKNTLDNIFVFTQEMLFNSRLGIYLTKVSMSIVNLIKFNQCKYYLSPFKS